MLLQAAIGHVAAVAGENFGLRQIGGRSVFVRVAEDEFARLERRAGAGRRHFAGAFDDRLRKPVAVAEMVVRIVERRRRLQVQRREHLHAFALCDELVVLGDAACALGGVAGKQDGDGVEVRAGEAAHPVVRMILSGVAEHLRAGDHALLELFGERGQRSLIHAKRAQAVPGEGHRHPAFVVFDRSHDFRGRLHLFKNRRQPCPSARGVAKRKKFVSSRERGRPSQQDVLDVFVFKHGAPRGGSLHLIEHVRECRLELERFLDFVRSSRRDTRRIPGSLGTGGRGRT